MSNICDSKMKLRQAVKKYHFEFPLTSMIYVKFTQDYPQLNIYESLYLYNYYNTDGYIPEGKEVINHINNQEDRDSIVDTFWSSLYVSNKTLPKSFPKPNDSVVSMTFDELQTLMMESLSKDRIYQMVESSSAIDVPFRG